MSVDTSQQAMERLINLIHESKAGREVRTQAIVTLRALLAERDALIHDIERAKESESALLTELEQARGIARQGSRVNSGPGLGAVPCRKSESMVRHCASRSCLFDGIERPEVHLASVNPDLRHPATIARRATYARDAGFIVNSPEAIFLVLLGGHVSQISDAVIQRIAIDMINDMLGPFAIVDSPCNAVRADQLT